MHSDSTKELMYKWGERNGLAGLSPSCTSEDYMKGYWQGWRVRAEKRVYNDCSCKCNCDYDERM